MLRRLLVGYPLDRLCVFANSRVLEELDRRTEGAGLLEAPHRGVQPVGLEARGLRRLGRLLNLFRVRPAAARIAQAASSEATILAFPWGGSLGSELFVAAYLAHRASGARLVVYEMDEWRASLGRRSGFGAVLLERLFHGAILRAADAVCVTALEGAWNAALEQPVAVELARG